MTKSYKLPITIQSNNNIKLQVYFPMKITTRC